MSQQEETPKGSGTSPENPAQKDKGKTTYNPAAMGQSFANEFASMSIGSKIPEEPADSNPAKNPPVPGGNSEAQKRFGQNQTGLLIKNGSASDTTEIANKKDKPKGEGIYGRGSFTPRTRKGKKIVDADTSLFPFNYVAGRRSESVLSVGKDDRMSPPEAKDKLLGILAMFGVENESHEYLYTFTHALLVAHALNGASIAGPGRATFSVDGDVFTYGDVVKYLGPDARRFYRAFADETAKALLSVLERYDPGDSTTVMLCGQIRFLAVSKKLTQYPYLIHDSADACYRTSVTEMAAVTKSKQFVLNSGSAGNTIENLEKQVEG